MIKISKEIFERLKSSVEFFHDFSDLELFTFLKFMNPEHFADRDIIFEEDVPGDKLFILINGQVSITKRTGKKGGVVKETELAVIQPGQCFGEMGLIDRRARSAKATAKGNAVLFSITETMLIRISNSRKFFPISLKLYRNFAQMLARRLRDSNQKVVELAAKFQGNSWL
ncbi:cyclic nucleotide-binding domain-containing protein [bacterium]|nr:cyclic nucleotide-binding domain-containing protein [bacterium]